MRIICGAFILAAAALAATQVFAAVHIDPGRAIAIAGTSNDATMPAATASAPDRVTLPPTLAVLRSPAAIGDRPADGLPAYVPAKAGMCSSGVVSLDPNLNLTVRTGADTT